MDSGALNYMWTPEFKKISQIQFGILSPDELRKLAVTKIIIGGTIALKVQVNLLSMLPEINKAATVDIAPIKVVTCPV